MNQLSGQTANIYNHPLTVSNAVLRINTNIIKIHRSMKDVALAQDLASIKESSGIVDVLEKKVYGDFEIINERFLGEKIKYRTALDVFTEWKPIRDEVIALMHAGQRIEAADITKGKGAMHVVKLEKAMEALGDFAQMKAADFLFTAEDTKEKAFNTMYLVSIFALIIGTAFAVYLTRSITHPIKGLRAAADKVGRGDLSTAINIESGDELAQLADSFNKMTGDLKNITASRDELDKEINERKQAEEEQSLLQKRLEAQWKIARMVDADRNIICNYALTEIINLTESRYGFYGFLNEDESIMNICAWSKQVMEDCRADKEHIAFPLEKSGIWGDAIRKRKSLIINDLSEEHPSKKGVPEGHVTITRLIVTPIFRHDRIVAVGAVANKAENYIEKDLEQMVSFLHSVQVMLDKRLAEEELKKHREHLMDIVEERTSELRVINEELEKEISERKQAEAESIRTSQLASLGELAAGVAHEINNPINGIINYSQILANKSIKGSREEEIADRIIKEGDRISEIVTNLLSFARATDKKKGSAKIHEILLDTLTLTGAQIRKDGIHLKVDVSQDLPEITAHYQQIEQVFLNIISNARYALAEKHSDKHDNKKMEIFGEKVTVDNKPYIRIVFYDNGPGIAPVIKDKIMNPFFTTKPSNEGTGLGLSISHGIINDHDGRLSFESLEGEYTKVIIDLPQTS
jgi:signal transduction histidine kinase